MINLPAFKNIDTAKKFLKIFYMVGIIGLSVSYTQKIFKLITPLTLLLVASILFAHHNKWKFKIILVFLFIFLASFFAEVAGVNSGEIFGVYQYGRTLGPKLLNTPIIIGINWLMLLYCTYIIASKLKVHIILKLVLASFLMVLYDLILEPFAIMLDMWNWCEGKIPLQNYIAWFVLSFFFHTIFYISRLKPENRLAGFIYLIQLFFFVIIDINLVLIPLLQ